MSDNVPIRWTISFLSDVVDDYQSGFASGNKDVENGLFHLRMNNISNDGRLNLDLLRTVPRDLARPYHYLKKDDLLICTTNSAKLVGKSVIFDKDGLYAFSNHLTRVRVRKEVIYSRYLFYYLFLLWYQGGYELLCKHWVNQSTLSKESLLSLEIPLAPLNEQERIVDKLDVLLSKVNACKERLDKIPAILKRFRQSVLTAACSGKLTADWRHDNKQIRPSPRFESIAASATDDDSPDTWEKVRSADLFSFVTSGSRGWARYYSDEGSIFIRIGNLDHGTISLDLKSVQRVNPPTGAEGVRTRVCPNDILISITADVGMVALVPENIGEAYINQHVALARPKADLCSKYLAWYLAASEGGLKQFQEMQRGATKVGLGLDDINNVWIPMPPIPEQHEIVRRVEALFKLADDIEKRYGKARAHIDKLTQSILAKAFRGELVPQDPNDEPASALLQRIRAEREKRETDGRTGPQGSGRRVRAGIGTSRAQ